MNKKVLPGLILISSALLPVNYAAADNKLEVKNGLIEITQIPCQFLESEGKDRTYNTNSKADCQKINEKTSGSRKLSPLILKPGKYTFKVTNKNVPYEVGFYLRGKGWGWLTQPSVSGGGLFKGVTKEYTVDLKPGEYIYSCPLNPTLDYPLIVKE